MAIPLPGQPGDALLQGLNTGSNMMNRLMQQRHNQNQLQQQWQEHLRNAAIREQQEARLNQILPYQIANYEQAAELHPFKVQAAQQAQQMGPQQFELLKAKIDAERARAEKARREPSSNYKPSELERIAAVLGEGDPEKQRAILAEGGATKYGLTLPGAEDLPVGSQPFKSLPKNLQAQENADQIKMQSRVNDARKANHDLSEMEKIIDAYPDMARDFAYILGNPEDKNFISNLARRYIDKKKLAQIEKFVKYSNDFVLSAGGGLGNNFTDAKLKALQLSKMHAGNTAEANRAIINNYRSRLKPLVNYGSYLKKARGKYTLPYFEESYTDEALGVRPVESLSDEELNALAGGA